VIDLYLDHLRIERRLSGHTLESYARDLGGLAAFSAGMSCKPEALDRSALETFVRQRMKSGLSPRSVARAVAAIRGYYRFLVLDRRLDESPADDLRPPRAWPALPKFLSFEEVDTLIAAPDGAMESHRELTSGFFLIPLKAKSMATRGSGTKNCVIDIANTNHSR